MINFTTDFVFEKMKKPSVTVCCTSLSHAEVNGAGTKCYNCGKILHHNLRTITLEDAIKIGLCYNEEQFNSMYYGK